MTPWGPSLIDRGGWGTRLLLGLTSFLVAGAIGLLSRTYRYRIVAGGLVLDRLRAEGRPLIVSFWHDRSIAASGFVLRYLHRRGLPLTMLASHSRDGELVGGVGRRFGLPVVRGSASRGGREALIGTYRAVQRHRSSPIMLPDGPRGPRYHFKLGVAVLAQLTGAPVLPLGFAARHFRSLRSWDRLVLPLPFSLVAVVVEEPVEVRRQLDAPQLESVRAGLESTLVAATAAATRAVAGARDGGATTPAGAAG